VPEAQRDYFLFELQNGSRSQAEAAYTRLRSGGYWKDPLGYYRLALSLRYPASSWAWCDSLGILALLILLVVQVLAPLLIIAPIHYRGLVLLVRGRLPEPPPAPWHLRHVWYALAAFLVAGTFAVYVFAYDYLESLVVAGSRHGLPVDFRSLGRGLIWQSGLFLLVALPLLRGVNVRAMLLGNWSWLRCALTGAGYTLLMRIAIVAYLGLLHLFHSPAALGGDTTRALQGIYAQYGVLAVVFMSCLAAPALEEFLFRGVLLTAFRRHVASFWTAALAQAILFAAMHGQLAMMPIFTGFGLLAAALYRRSGGLLAPMVMHATYNLSVVLQIISATDAINHAS
jgi:membrane protease YdiL (CAAX protease family)